MRRPLLARNAKLGVTVFVTFAAAVAGCAAIAGINDGAEGTKPSGDGEASDDGKTTGTEGGTTADGATPCVATSMLQPTGAIHAQQASAPPIIDGKFDEWTCVDRIDIGQGAFSKGMPPGAQRVEFAMQWTLTDLYFYAHPVTTAPGFDNMGNQIYANDGVQLMIGRDPAPTTSGSYRTGDHQLTFDYRGRFGDYVNGMLVGSSVAAVASSDGAAANTVDFQVEARITALSLGLTKFISGQKLIVNIMLVDATAMDAFGFRIWRLPPKATCPCEFPNDPQSCCAPIGTQDTPTCDIRCTDSLVLD